jgi:hydroxylaminobenzene mutase
MKHGMILFLLGLLTGLAIPQMHNPRMGVSAHLEGVLNGIFLVVLGLGWEELRLTERVRKAAFALVLFGAYANWSATLLAALLGTSKLTPIAGSGFTGSEAAEALVSVMLVLVALSMIGALSLFVAGLRAERGGSAGTLPG